MPGARAHSPRQEEMATGPGGPSGRSETCLASLPAGGTFPRVPVPWCSGLNAQDASLSPPGQHGPPPQGIPSICRTWNVYRSLLVCILMFQTDNHDALCEKIKNLQKFRLILNLDE